MNQETEMVHLQQFGELALRPLNWSLSAFLPITIIGIKTKF